MNRFIGLILVLSLIIIPANLTQAENNRDSDVKKEVNDVTIDITELNVTDKTLELHYEIRNGSNRDIWICDGVSGYGKNFEVFLSEDGQTLMIRRRFDVPTQKLFESPPIGRYIRLPVGHNRSESLLLSLPIRCRELFVYSGFIKDSVYVKRLAIEIGYYVGDLNSIIIGMLEKTERIIDERVDKKFDLIDEHLRILLHFNELNERLRQRDEQIIIPYGLAFKGEKILKTTLDIQKIPYIGRSMRPGYKPPDLSLCTRAEIQYQPSMLEYFFAYAAERSLLSSLETQYLQSLKEVVVNDSENLKSLVNDVCRSKGEYDIDGIVCERSKAKIVCYCDGDKIISFNVYDDETIENEEKQRIGYTTNLKFLWMITPQIKPYEIRIQCAGNLKDLYHRFRLYHKAQELQPKRSSLREHWYRWRFYQKVDKAYPATTKWCDAMVWAYGTAGMLVENIEKPFKCIGSSDGKGKCTYALNPNCRYDSSPDTVLLFETKAGWNQHGCPELFTFDNHEPRGGCVLLNDGTVKFIRTQEELQQLRWK